MTSKRFIHRRKRGLYSSEKSAQMNKARWDADRARREAEMPERLRELAEIEMMNLPRKQGDILGSLQWTDARTGKVRRWVIRIGDRADRITMENPDGRKTGSHGWSWVMTHLRPYLAGRK
jgi:hypothetical protein